MTWLTLAKRWQSFTSSLTSTSEPSTAELVRDLLATPLLDTVRLPAALSEAIGRTLTYVVIAKGQKGPWRMFLIFADETHFEFYGTSTLSSTKGVYRGGLEHVRRATRHDELVQEITAG